MRKTLLTPKTHNRTAPPAATVYGKDADSWASDNMNSPVSENAQYAAQLDAKQGYRTCERGGWRAIDCWERGAERFLVHVL